MRARARACVCGCRGVVFFAASPNRQDSDHRRGSEIGGAEDAEKVRGSVRVGGRCGGRSGAKQKKRGRALGGKKRLSRSHPRLFRSDKPGWGEPCVDGRPRAHEEGRGGKRGFERGGGGRKGQRRTKTSRSGGAAGPPGAAALLALSAPVLVRRSSPLPLLDGAGARPWGCGVAFWGGWGRGGMEV